MRPESTLCGQCLDMTWGHICLLEEQKWNLKRFEIFLRYSENGWLENLKCMMQI